MTKKMFIGKVKQFQDQALKKELKTCLGKKKRITKQKNNMKPFTNKHSHEARERGALMNDNRGVGQMNDNDDKKLKKQKGTIETRDAGVTYYGSNEDLASGDGPSTNQGSASGNVYAQSYGVKVPSSQSLTDARETEAAINTFDNNMKRNAKNRGTSVLNEDARRRKTYNYDPRRG